MKSSVNTYFTVFILTLVCLVSFYAFDQKEEEENSENVELFEEEISPLVQKNLDEKLERYKNTILDRCRVKAFEAAEIYIDSLVSEELKLQASDTLRFPAKPTRPILKSPIILNDSTFITPIIK